MWPARKVEATVALRGGLSRTHLSPRSEEAAHAVISVHPVNSYGSSDVLPEGDLPAPAPVLLCILGLLALAAFQYFPHSAGLKGRSCGHCVSGSVPSALWSFLIESSTLQIHVVIIPRLREVKSFPQDHTAGEAISAS